MGLRVRPVGVHAQHARGQFLELLVAAVAVEADDYCFGSDAGKLVRLSHGRGSGLAAKR